MTLTEEELALCELGSFFQMPLYKIKNEMPYDEYITWLAFFEKKPIGWKEDLRTAYIMNALGDKRKPNDIFPGLTALYKKSSPEEGFKGSALFHKLLTAKGGDKLDLLGM